MEKRNVIIIGAGIAGISAAYHLNKSGFNVTVLEKNTGTNNCSYGNAGMIVPSHIVPLASPGIISQGLRWMLNPESPFYIRPRLSGDLFRWGWEFRKASTNDHVEAAGPVLRDLLTHSRKLLIELEQEEKLDFGFEKKGLFMFCNTDKGLEKEMEVAEKANALGVTAKTLTSDEVNEKEPELELNIIGATYYPQDAHLHPGKLMDQLKELLKKRGVTFRYNTEVTGFETERDQIIRVKCHDDKNWQGDIFIICNGVWSTSLAKSLGKKLPMQAGKGYSITIRNPKILPRNCGILAERKVTMTPMLGFLRFGGTMEIVGTDQSINSKKINGLKKSVCEYLPQFKETDLEGYDIWTGLRPISPDGLPYAGRINGYKNLYTSTGHAMMGMSLAPSCGKLISDLIINGKSPMEHPMINPNRYCS